MVDVRHLSPGDTIETTLDYNGSNPTRVVAEVTEISPESRHGGKENGPIAIYKVTNFLDKPPTHIDIGDSVAGIPSPDTRLVD